MMISISTTLDLVHCNAEDLPFADNMFDVVFHVGGINFFSDQQKAINEMLRVAKPSTKIMIADEITDFIQQQYKKTYSRGATSKTPIST